MTQSVSVLEIQAAGGLDKWAARAPQSKAIVPPAAPAMARTPLPAGLPAAKGRKSSDSLIGYDIDRMNGLEARYAGHLEGMRRAGKILSWHFEALKLRLADSTFYTPDFFIMLPDGAVGFHETKGFWRDDAKAKIKIAAALYPLFFFVAVQWDSKAKSWKYEKFGR